MFPTRIFMSRYFFRWSNTTSLSAHRQILPRWLPKRSNSSNTPTGSRYRLNNINWSNMTRRLRTKDWNNAVECWPAQRERGAPNVYESNVPFLKTCCSNFFRILFWYLVQPRLFSGSDNEVWNWNHDGPLLGYLALAFLRWHFLEIWPPRDV